jgi:hypothetical protein
MAKPRSFASVHNHAVIRGYDAAGNVIETHEHKGEFKEPVNPYGLENPSLHPR